MRHRTSRYTRFVQPSPTHPSRAPRTATGFVLDGVSRRYGDRVVLDAVTVRWPGTGIVGIVGANGRGKTTLLRILAQLCTPDDGAVQVAGFDVQRGDHDGARRLTGWSPHEPLAWRNDTVTGNLRYAARLSGATRAQAAQHAARSVARWQLAEVAGVAVRQLSRGWLQRYSLARADVLEPPLLLLDEPTTGLDLTGRALLEHRLEAWRATRTVVVASHERAWLAARCEHLVDLDEARP